ncbi:hypothetical protein OEA41_004471 [Lepraria neglecta]|uniref:chitinase n=1 Tax=Lepraria neglecta TaxID=209136 RepID=A0AAE0DG64_9LECA|nr:hypothetical protein OEA41_004471 [Lepraria neglecta]
MDTSTPSSLFQDTANLKSVKPDLKIFISVGGWSFSDNGTVTQPLYSEIAADAGKRQTFANNVVHFMRQYGFDGLDIDWEYPGASDRGGSKADTANFVTLLQNLRQTFDASGNHFGLTFTAPSSYWYLRWFDLPNLIKYADWINLMTYDLHGVWDATNPIGSIVQGHTNLTEIKLAAELFWRVNIPPSKLVMGFGFYGRSFTLADPSCNTPGCPFSGASNPGPCTGTGGILSYYEIMDVLHGGSLTKRDTSIKPTHDTTDAVNYFTFNNNQWVSYDDAVTFKQKTDWADSVGLGGALIWASDLDDDKYTAHSGLLGRTVLSTSSLQTVDKALSSPQSVIQDLAGSNGQNCFAYQGKCVNLNDNNAMQAACRSGFTVVGWDDAGCGKKKCVRLDGHCGKPICCPTNEAPKNCIWRGDNNGQGTASDCSAQCLPGETNIKGIGSSWGGGFLNDGNTNKCGRGFKERAKESTYIAVLPNGFELVIVAAIYPAIGRLYEVPNAGQVLRRLFRLIQGWCIGPAVNVATVAPGSNPPGLGGMQTEHPVDRQIAARFIEAASSGLLRNRYPTHLPGIGSNFFQNYWDHPLHGLANAPAVGGLNGAKPLTPNDRMMEAFGSDDYPYPLLPTDQQINGPKGNLMNLNAPADLGGIGRLARTAVQQDTPQAADTLLSEVRVIFAIFEYMNTNDFATRFNAVRDQVRTQLGHIEQASGVQNLQSWWDVFTNDYFLQIEDWAQSWADQAITAAAAPYLSARNSGRNPRTYAQVINTMQQWHQLLATILRFPPYTGSMPLPYYGD